MSDKITKIAPPPKTPEIRIERETLSDGSYVFNVTMPPGPYHAVSGAEAFDLAGKLKAAIDAHTVDEVAIKYVSE